MSDVKGKERETARDAPKMEPKYEIYVRLPFNRGDFVDPPPVDWNEAKSDALWNIISGVERSENKIDWNELATSFDVGVDFLLMMAQTLAERHTNQLMGLFRKAAAVTGGSGGPSPVTGAFPGTVSAPETVAGEVMKRTASGSGRPSSPATIRRESPLPRTDTSTPSSGTPLKSSLAVLRPPVTSRASSAATTVPTQSLSTTPKTQTPRPKSPIRPPHRPSNLYVSTTGMPSPKDVNSTPSPSSPGKSSLSASSSASSSPVQSRIIKRPPRPTLRQGVTTSLFPDDDDDDDEAEPAFLPYTSPDPASAGGSSAATQDLGATLRGAPGRSSASSSSRRPPASTKAPAHAFLSSPSASNASDRQHDLQQSATSDSSASSTAAPRRRPDQPRGGRAPHLGPLLSPRRTAELAGRSPGGSKGAKKEGSDGTPSMGSSFSDLDDASVTQSALEEALASKMQDGGATIGSRMTTFGNAFRSRYLPKGNQ